MEVVGIILSIVISISLPFSVFLLSQPPISTPTPLPGACLPHNNDDDGDIDDTYCIGFFHMGYNLNLTITP